MSFTVADIQELEEFFRSVELPATVELEPGTKITNIRAFLESHFLTLNSSIGRPVYEPHLRRLRLLREILIKKA